MTFLESIALAQEAALQRFGLRVAVDVAAEDEPIQLADAYAHLRIDADSAGSPDDVWLEGQIIAARQYCEQYLGRALAPRTLELSASAFPGVAVETPPGAFFELPFGPVTAVESVTYTDTDDAAQSFVDTDDTPLFELDAFAHPARVVTLYGESWPTARASTNSVVVRYRTGYLLAGDSSGAPSLPRTARSAMLLMLGMLYDNRSSAGKDDQVLDRVHDLLNLVPNRERLGFA